MLNEFVIGKSIKTFNKNGNEEFLSVQMSHGDIVLLKDGVVKATRQLSYKNGYDVFTYRGVEYARMSLH